MCGSQVQFADVLEERIGVELRDLPRILSLQCRLLFEAILTFAASILVEQMPDVREIHDLQNLVALELQKAAQQIGEQKRTEVPDVNVVIHGWAAVVHAHLPGLDGNEFFDLAAERVMKTYHVDDSGL